ncbi:MAG: nucleotidyltransferase family protein [Thermoplasmata archaeon]|nr:nucleotidyltransferase family protein [Thermoplasmata archaeon]MCI4358920.1 nucleotidyltransferase family protein [Thermoplasmata archaeon]
MAAENDRAMEPRGPVAVILSAGESRRFGGRPKALLPVGRETAIARIARIAQRAGASRVIAVLGPLRKEIERALDGHSVDIEENAAWPEGRTGSVQLGLRAAGDATPVLVWPVDHPFVAEPTVDRLFAAASRDALATWVVPSFRGGGGHPVLLQRAAIRRVLELPSSAPLRSLIPVLGPQVLRVPVEDPGVLENVDSFDAYWSALEAWKRRGGEIDGP